jgi:hypothetical protein
LNQLLIEMQAVVNHENAIACLSKGIARIAAVLPRVELAALLYPTKRMKVATEELYAYILHFSSGLTIGIQKERSVI